MKNQSQHHIRPPSSETLALISAEALKPYRASCEPSPDFPELENGVLHLGSLDVEYLYHEDDGPVTVIPASGGEWFVVASGWGVATMG